MKNWRLILFSIVVIFGLAGSAILAARNIPAGTQLPIHWGIDGRPDGYARRWVALLMPSALAAFLTLLFAFLGQLEPRQDNLAISQGLYRTLWIGTLGLMCIVQIMLLAAVLHWRIAPSRLLVPALGLFFVLVGNQLGKSQRMYMVGIRTPWMLADPDVWIATHRLGGKLMAAAGLLWLAAAAIGTPGPYMLMALFAAMLLAALVPMAYSYRLWRKLPRERAA